jgi:IPT/TIG domain-containing protein
MPMARAPRLAVISLLAITLAMLVSCGTCSPAPLISSITPSSVTAGGNQFLLTVNGNGFRHDSMVEWNGSSRLTSFVSSHQLVAVITAADIAQPGTAVVFVFNPPEGGTTFVSGGLGVISAPVCASKTSIGISFIINP